MLVSCVCPNGHPTEFETGKDFPIHYCLTCGKGFTTWDIWQSAKVADQPSVNLKEVLGQFECPYNPKCHRHEDWLEIEDFLKENYEERMIRETHKSL